MLSFKKIFSTFCIICLLVSTDMHRNGGTFMKDNIGNFKELEMINALNGKKIKDLNQNLKFMVKEIFGVVDEEETIKAESIDKFIKPDFSITYKGITKHISMKSGQAESLHQEDIKKFIFFLRKFNVSERTQKTILLYQYGDMTLDGSGKERLPYVKLRSLLAERLKLVNEELNKNSDLVKAIAERTIFKGTFDENIAADYVYHGDVNYGITVSKAQIMRFIELKKYKFIDVPHFGPILFRPHARYIGKEIKNPESRQKVDFYWPRLESSLRYISARYYG